MLFIILLSMQMILLSTPSGIIHMICGNNLASELESDLRNPVNWGRKWLVDFNTGKTQLVLFDRSNNTGGIDAKMDGSVLEVELSFKMLGLTFSSKLD